MGEFRWNESKRNGDMEMNINKYIKMKQPIKTEKIYLITGLSIDHPAQRDFNEFMQKQKEKPTKTEKVTKDV